MYALVEIQGRQYRVEEGSQVTVNRMAGAADTVELPNVLLIGGDGEVRVGRPYVDGAKITATLEDHPRGPKIRIYKYKRRKKYRRTLGHRQDLTRLRINSIQAGS